MRLNTLSPAEGAKHSAKRLGRGIGSGLAEVRLNELTKVEGNVVTLEALKAANILTKDIQFAKVILAGEVKSAVTVRGLRVTKGAKAAIEAAGGSVEE